MLDDVILPSHVLNPNPDIYWSDNYVVFDFETTNLDSGSALNQDNRLVLSTWQCGPGHKDGRKLRGVEYSYGPQLPVGLKVAIDSADFIVAQNAKFELQWLQREGVDISKLVVYDTLIGEYVRLGNRRGPKDLDAIAKRYALEPKLSIVKLLIHAGVCPGEIPKRWLVTYGCLDTEITAQVFLRQRRELSELRLLPHLYTRCLLTPVLADIERNGMQLDEERVNEEYNRAKLEFDRAEARLADAYPGINFSSRRQLG